MLKKVFQKLGQETNFVLILIAAITVLGLASLFIDQFVRNSPDTIYSFAHNYMPDYYQYLSWMKDGADGKILVTSRYSAQTFVRRPVYLFYSLGGFLGSKASLNNFVTYTILRIGFSLLKLFVLYLLIAELFRKSFVRKLAFFLALFLPPFYRINPLRMILPYISSIDPLQRTFFIPHNLAAVTFLMLGVILFNRWLRKSTSPFLILACLAFFLAANSNPAMLSIFYVIFFFGVVLTLSKNNFKSLAIGTFLVGLVGLPVVLYARHVFNTTLPFSWLYAQQKFVTLGVGFKDYLLGLGPVGILFIFGLPSFFQKKDFLAKFVISWAILPFIFLPLLGKTIPLSQERLFEISHFIPLSVLSASGLCRIWSKVKLPKAQRLFLGLAFVLYLILAIPSFCLATNFLVRMFAIPYYNIYIPKSTVQAFNWLDKNTPDESNVVAGYYTANMLPAFSHNKVLFGHDYVTYYAKERLKENNLIFDKNGDPLLIKDILSRFKIRYILLTPETPKFTETNLPKLGILKLVFANEGNAIFQVGN